MNTRAPFRPRRQHGVALVEFALVSLIFLTLLFAIFEFSRLLYVYNTLQEVTRRAAREATVRWYTDEDAVKKIALFNSTTLPAGAEVTTSNIEITYLNAAGGVASPLPSDPGDNLSACGDATRVASCIYTVNVRIVNVSYVPMLSILGLPSFVLPESTVQMHAESMGFSAY